MSLTFLDAIGSNLILSVMPEPLGLLIFGVALILFAGGLRRIFDRNDDRRAIREFEQTKEN